HPDLLMFYETPNPVEQTLYTMFLEHRMRTFQGAFHMNPDYLHWYGWAEMRRDLAEIKAEAARLRKEHGGEKKT
ncbi:MAG TPA: cytochrome C, partial [Phycisphaerae bacterium]|nr:cytochrome C [Phycisphaerae bacterium]